MAGGAMGDEPEDIMARSEADWRNYVAEELRTLHRDLNANTAVTQEVKELLELGRAFFRFTRIFGKVIAWAGTIATAVVAIYHLIYAATHNGKLP